MKKNIKLTEKQAMILWMVFGWFQGQFKNTGLMSKLYELTGHTFRVEHKKEYERIILRRIVDVGNWIQKEHPELLKETK